MQAKMQSRPDILPTVAALVTAGTFLLLNLLIVRRGRSFGGCANGATFETDLTQYGWPLTAYETESGACGGTDTATLLGGGLAVNLLLALVVAAAVYWLAARLLTRQT